MIDDDILDISTTPPPGPPAPTSFLKRRKVVSTAEDSTTQGDLESKAAVVRDHLPPVFAILTTRSLLLGGFPEAGRARRFPAGQRGEGHVHQEHGLYH